MKNPPPNQAHRSSTRILTSHNTEVKGERQGPSGDISEVGAQGEARLSEVSIVAPVAAGVLAYAFLHFPLLTSAPANEAIFDMLQFSAVAVQNMVVENGWAIVGAAIALLASAVTAVSIVGFRGGQEHRSAKLIAIRSTINLLISLSAALSGGLIAASFSAFISLPITACLLGGPDIGVCESGLIKMIEAGLGHSAALKLLGNAYFVWMLGAMGFVTVRILRSLKSVVSVWFRSDAEVSVSERRFLESKIEQQDERICRLRESRRFRADAESKAWAFTAFQFIFLSFVVAIWLAVASSSSSKFIQIIMAIGLLCSICFAIVPFAREIHAERYSGPVLRRVGESALGNLRMWRLKVCFRFAVYLILPAVLLLIMFDEGWGSDKWVVLSALVVPFVLNGFYSGKFSWAAAGRRLAIRKLSIDLEIDRGRLRVLKRGSSVCRSQ